VRQIDRKNQLSRATTVVVINNFVAFIFFAYYIRTLNEFYWFGTYFLDAGLIAHLLSHFEFSPNGPAFTGGGPFFAAHFSPLLPLWGEISTLAGWFPPKAFAVYQGFFHGLLALVGAGLSETPLRQPWDALCRGLVGVALAFSPIALDAIAYPHFEMAIPILFLAFCYALSLEKVAVASIAFALMLITREDAGFHAFAFLAAYVTSQFIEHRKFSRSAALVTPFAIVGFFYSVFALVFQHVAFDNAGAFASNYSGTPFFAHVTRSLVFERVATLCNLRPELLVLTATVLFLGVVSRNLPIIFGVAAILPWTILHLLAVRDAPGQLFSYYAFPFLILMAWPLVVDALSRLDAEETKVAARGGSAVAAFLMISAVCWLTFFGVGEHADGRTKQFEEFLPKTSAALVERINRFSSSLAKLIKSSKTNVFVDDAIASLIPSRATPDNHISFVLKKNLDDNRDYIIVYFTSYEPQAGEIEGSYLQRASDACFKIAGTNIRLLTKGAGELITSGMRDVQKLDCSKPGRN
jgi:hypothetical protein